MTMMRNEEQVMTDTKAKRILQAMNETYTLLNKELQYAPDLQKVDMVNFYRQHIVNLTAMLNKD